MKHLARKPIPAAPAAAPGSLAAALTAVPDPRQPYGWRPGRAPLPLVGLLQTVVAAMLCGARSLYAVAQWSRERVEDEPAALVPLGLPPGRSPSVATLHRILKALDVGAFERAVGTWVAANGIERDDALALDGKTLRGVHRGDLPGVHLVAAYAHAAGLALDQVASAGKGHELAAAETLVATLPLAGRVVTGDALLTQRDLCIQIVAGGGDYLLPVKDNQSILRADLEAAFSPGGTGSSGRGGASAAAVLAGAGACHPGRRAVHGDGH